MDPSFANSDLARLEQELTTRPRSGAPRELRARVLHEVKWNLQEEERRGVWLFAASVAAAVVVWINLSWFAARQTEFVGSYKVSTASLAEMTDQIHELVPELSRREARRQALLLQGRGNLREAPVPMAPIYAVH